MDLAPIASFAVETTNLSLSGDKPPEYQPKTLIPYSQARVNYLPTYPTEVSTSEHAPLLANVPGLSFSPDISR